MIRTLTALAEPNRLRIMEHLRDGARSVNEIGARLGLNQPQASKHLRVLHRAGLVVVAPVAQQRLYALNPDGLRALHTWIERYRALWEARFVQFDALVEDMQRKEEAHADRKPARSRRKKPDRA